MLTSLLKENGNWVIIAAFVALLLPIIIIESSVLLYTNGIWSYPIEDPFIHMSIAKNIAQNHIWGTSAHEFTSASSSILYPIIISIIFFIIGPHTFIPFAINLMAAVLIILVLNRWLKTNKTPIHGQIITYFLVIFVTPLPVLVILGMEHTLHLLISLIYVLNFSNYLDKTKDCNHKNPSLNGTIYLFGILLTSIRFEGLFLVFTTCLVLLWKRQIKNSLLLGIISSLPVVIFGIISISLGSFFLPNSVLLKSSNVPSDFSSFINFITEGIWQKLYFDSFNWSQITTSKLILILPLLYILCISLVKNKYFYSIIFFLLTATTILHICLGRVGWFFRYEAYLIGLTASVLGMLSSQISINWNIENWTWRNTVISTVVLYMAMPFFFRSLDAFNFTDIACKYTYDQNYLISQFLHKFYNTTNVAINDLGAMTYYTKSQDLDLDGLGSIEIAKSIKGKYYTPEFVDSLVKKKQIKIGVIFERLATPPLQAKWKKIASWHSPYHINYVNTDFQFYAIDTTYAASLKSNLLQFLQTVPKDVYIKVY